MKSDRSIEQDVLDELSWDPCVGARVTEVTVVEGHVGLRGVASSYAEKAAAERASRRVAGVRSVSNDLAVVLAAGSARSDAAIEAAADRALAGSVLVAPKTVTPVVEAGWLKLDGQVAWDYQRAAAERVVRDLPGIVGITNRIAVLHSVTADAIQAGIEAALARRAERGAHHVKVVVDGTRVTLRGRVASWAERQAAAGVAVGTHGVRDVVNELVVEH
jgi:osmotically-inducible protein OsmY